MGIRLGAVGGTVPVCQVEMIQMAAIAMKMGVTKTQWDAACAVHPTLSEELVTMREKYVPLGLGQVA